MTKSARGIVVASFVVACLPLAAGTLQDPDVVLVSEGIIDVSTATDGRQVVVSVDTASPTHPADGIVDRASATGLLAAHAAIASRCRPAVAVVQ